MIRRFCSTKRCEMEIRYFPESDMLYIQLMDGVSTESEEVAPDIVFDIDASSGVLGIEIEDASQRVDISRLEISALPLVDLVFSQQKVASSLGRKAIGRK